MTATTQGTSSRTRPASHAPSIAADDPAPFIIDREALVTRDDDALSMSQAGRFFGHSTALKVNEWADTGVVVDGVRRRLATFPSSETRRMTTRRACEWFARVLGGDFGQARPASSPALDGARARAGREGAA